MIKNIFPKIKEKGKLVRGSTQNWLIRDSRGMYI